MSSKECPKCGKTFARPALLQRHLARKTPCEPIVERRDDGIAPTCKYCGRSFTTATSMYRHVRMYCRIANSDEGMEKLMDHTLQRQNAALEEKVDRLTALVEQLAGAQMAGSSPPTTHISTVNVTNHITQVNTVVNIKTFDIEERIYIPVSLVKAAFTENPRLMEYCHMTDEERTDADKAAPYVLEALVDLIRRAHRDPLYRNVHLNPRRADQVMVCIGEEQRWEVRGLIDVIRVLFDGVADNLQKIITTDKDRTQLPFDVQSAASWVPNLYEDEPERFVKDGRGPMAAHLANTAPVRAETPALHNAAK
jgi:uncharacterized C2H2 Zn-finger protein